MNNWLLLLAYDGFQYHGWQIQKAHNTIEAELENAILSLTSKPTIVMGAGRTDAKVHALNQTANFHSDSTFSTNQWRSALNALLPSDIIVKCVLPVPSPFHARHSATAKRYRYLIYNKLFATPFAKHYSWWIRKPLDILAMQNAAQHLIGEHDFSAFRASQCSSPNPVKFLNDIQISEVNTSCATLSIEVEANSFLQHMVRIIVGTLVAIGEHRFLPDNIPSIIQSKNRQKSGKTAPPYGLYVLKVSYNDSSIQWPANVIDI